MFLLSDLLKKSLSTSILDNIIFDNERLYAATYSYIKHKINIPADCLNLTNSK